MDYNNGFILQKKMVSSNRSVDWSLPNDGMTISVSACAPIFYFTRSQNNDSTNIIIISPRSSSLACYHRDARTTTGLSTRTIQGSIAKSSSLSLIMVRC